MKKSKQMKINQADSPSIPSLAFVMKHASGSERQRRPHQWPQWEINELGIAGLATLISLTEVPTGSGWPPAAQGGLEVRRCVSCVCVCVFHRTLIHLADTCQSLG